MRMYQVSVNEYGRKITPKKWTVYAKNKKCASKIALKRLVIKNINFKDIRWKTKG